MSAHKLRVMNPAYPTEAFPPEAVALQERGPDGFSGPPGYTTRVGHTFVNIPAEPPKDYIIWSLCNSVYGNIFCLGMVAFFFSIKVSLNKTFFFGKNCVHCEHLLLISENKNKSLSIL